MFPLTAPAHFYQVRIWDELRSVNGISIAGLDDGSIVDLVRGQPGTSVMLGLAGAAADGKCGPERIVTLQRGFDAPGAEMAR